MSVNVYLWSSLKSVKAAKTLNAAVGYLLEIQTKKGPATLNKTVLLSGVAEEMTANGAELYALKSALSRINIKCDVEIYTENRYIASAVENGWVQQWSIGGWVTKSGAAVANKEYWTEIWAKLDGVNVTWHVKEPHTYKKWLKEEVEENRVFVAPVQQKGDRNV